MTASEFLLLARKHRHELCRIIRERHPAYVQMRFTERQLPEGDTPVNAFLQALNARSYPNATQILQVTLNHMPLWETEDSRILRKLLDLKTETGENEMKKLKTYYVGSEHIAYALVNGTPDGHIYSTVNEAVNEAKARIREGNKDYMIVVKVVRILKRKNPEPPITIEEV